MDSIGLLKTAASGMEAQRAALDVAARNVAAAEAAGPEGSYERLVPQFRVVNDSDTSEIAFTGAQTAHGSRVDILTEMVSVMNASRAYEANASIFDLGKQLAQRTIDMGRV
jgi:flagellar basal body rod protein FlgC